MEDNCPVSSLYVDDIAIVINGTSLITRPKKSSTNLRKVIKLKITISDYY